MNMDWRWRPKDYCGLLSGLSRLGLLTVVLVWILIVFILLLPAITGGAEYQYHQGNIGDATNYAAMALFDRDFPVS